MKTARLFLAIICATLTGANATAADHGIRVGYSESLAGLELDTVQRSTSTDRSPVMHFEAFGRRLDFDLEPNRTLLDTVPGELPAGVEIYRGRLANAPGSWARFVVVDGQPQGIYFDGRELFAVEAPDGRFGSATPIVYRLADLEIASGALACQHTAATTNAAELVEAVHSEVSGPVAERALGAISTMDISLVADFEFTDFYGADTTAEMLARMNIVDGIFSAQLGVQLAVSHIDTYSTSSDPFGDATDSSLLLEEVADFRFDSADHRAAGLTHLFTGRSLNGNNVGIAYTGELCSTRFGAGLTSARNTVITDALVAAHEIGHNFGAPHDGVTGSPCESTPPTFLMATSVNGNDQFSACSLTEMQDDVANAACIETLYTNDVEVAAGVVPATVDSGASVTVTFDVNGTGVESSDNVALEITIPTTVTLNSVELSSGGACTSGGGVANCPIGTIVSGTGVTVTLDTTAGASGSATFVATATADLDENVGNNQSTSTFTVRSVNPPPGPEPEEDSGGGAFDWLMLLLLSAIGLSTRRRS